MEHNNGPSGEAPDLEKPEDAFIQRKKALRTSFGTQANALLRKNLIFQSRNWCTNICLVALPVVLCILLFLIQQLINSLLQEKCGCLCVQFDANNKCIKELCGVQYSKDKEAAYCPVDNPPEWPVFLQVPSRRYRAVQMEPTNYPDLPSLSCKASEEGCPATILYTGTNRTFADVIASNLLGTAVNDTNLNLLLQSAGYLTALATIVSATATLPISSLSYEPALIGLGYREDSSAYVLRNNCSSSVDLQLSANFFGNGSNGGIGRDGGNGGNGGNESLACLEGLTVWRNSPESINQEIYNGYYKARVYANRQINEYAAAYDFIDSTPSMFNATMYYNYTLSNDTGPDGPPPNIVRVSRAMNMVSSAFLKTITGGQQQLSLLFLKDYPKPGTELNLDFSSILGPLFFEWLFLLLLPVITRALVYEKEQNIRTMMKMHGLGDRAYWAITYVYFLILSLFYVLLTIISGSAINLKIFRLNDYILQIIFYFIFINSQIAFSFLLSTFFRSVRTATVVSYLYVLGSGLLGQFLYSYFLEDSNFSRAAVFVMELFPGFALYRGLYEFAQYAFVGNYLSDDGMRFKDLGDKDNGLIRASVILLVEWFIFIFVAYYLDQVVASGSGVKRHPLFFLQRWLPQKKSSQQISSRFSRFSRRFTLASRRAPVSVRVQQSGADVEREMALVDGLQGDTEGYSIVCDRLQKIYPPRDGHSEKVAVKGMSLAIRRGECFGILGPNGAGKTTSINMMIGFLAPSSGRAVIEGLEVGQDMDAIYSIMGVCPQHDLLWDQLTGREHLLFYGRLKNLKGPALFQAVEESLKSVNLWAGGVGNKVAGKYSGGMKRRLSVAISLVGNPLVVYMDEPSTGLDPASRKALWTAVKKAKRDRAIVLTTHSMEEAEALCDRLGIFVGGKFECIGNPKELTSRYGESFVFTITTSQEDEQKAESLVLSISQNARKMYHLAGTQKFELPTTEVDVADVFAAVERAKGSLDILAWGVTSTTLEDVFIKVAKGT